MKNALTVLLMSLLITPFSQAQDFNLQLRSNFTYSGQSLAGVWHYADSSGNEYALVGASQGLSIVNVTNPDSVYEIVQIPGPDNLWKEVRVWDHYAYISTEGGQGIQIVDLQYLPDDTMVYKHWEPEFNNDTLRNVHALHIDDGHLYLYGGNTKGLLIGDLSDPWNPTVAGFWEGDYIHDGYVIDDTLYACHIYAGFFSVMDVSDKANPKQVQTQPTPLSFTHNSWLSDDKQTLFITDEKPYSWVVAYDISDLDNITELDRYSTSDSGSTAHNVLMKGDYAVTAWYKDGVVIVDAHRPQTMVEVAKFDTYDGEGPGFQGTWGVCPYLPSGNILASNISEGLFVLTPTYERAAYVEGVITDSLTGKTVNDALVEVIGTNNNDVSDIVGNYGTGALAGTYDLKISKPLYYDKIVKNVTITSGNVTQLDIILQPFIPFSYNGQVIDSVAATGVPGAQISVLSEHYTFDTISDSNGNFTIPKLYDGEYEIVAGKWGYVTSCPKGVFLTDTVSPVTINLQVGYYDDFTFDYGWQDTGNAWRGYWELGEPQGANFGMGYANPEFDVDLDCSEKAYVTHNIGGNPYDFDVDSGYVLLKSPTFDLSTYTDPHLYYYTWFFNRAGDGTPNDTFMTSITNGIDTVILHLDTGVSKGRPKWTLHSFILDSFITATANMQLLAYAGDYNGDNILEAGLDAFQVYSGPQPVSIKEEELLDLKVYPNPFTNELYVEYPFDEKENIQLTIYDAIGRTVYENILPRSSEFMILQPELPKGWYVLSMRKGNTVLATQRLVKLR